jgi:hypothetical protein
MSTSSTADVLPVPEDPGARLALGFALTIFTSAFLLFQIEPLISKVILPWFGGSPAVWTTCLLFFQTLLFLGYAYAHFSTRICTRRQQVVLHLALVVLALALMPIAPYAHPKPTGSLHPTLGVLMLLTQTVGLPYFLLSSTGPLVQGWFGQAYPGRAPYRLYALSNVGSLLALVSYPFLFEPAFTTHTQARLWSWGFLGYALLLAVCTWSRWRAPKEALTSERSGSIPVASAPPSVGQRALWVGLPAFASVLLLATTSHVCENVAVIPFLWVAPLALYLLSFIIAFDGPRWYSRRGFAVAGVVLSLAVGCIDPLRDLAEGVGVELGFRELLVLDFSLLFVICMLCHGELVRLKPSADRLTEFYLFVAFGGALGGLLVSVACPALFSTFFEWSLSLLAAFALSLAVLAAGVNSPRLRTRTGKAVLAVPLVLGLGAIAYAQIDDDPPLEVARNFYGTVAVYDVDSDNRDDHHYSLTHGVVVHGRQYRAPEKQDLPLAYYSEASGVGRALGFFASESDLSVGAVGLGVGTLARYARPGQHFQFYEINPEVVRLAERYFTYLSRCGKACELVMGDARLSLERQEPQHFHVLVLDAFSGDAVPTHLLTQQAFDLYLRHLRPGGVIAVNITNRQLDLAPVLEGLAEQAGLKATRVYTEADRKRQLFRADWMLLTSNERFLAAVPPAPPPNLAAVARKVLWTDSYSNLFELLK